MEKLKTDVENGTFHLTQTHRFLTYRKWMYLTGNINQYSKVCAEYDHSQFEDCAQSLDYIFNSVKPEWEGYVFVKLLMEFMNEAVSNGDFDNHVENHTLFWERHLFQQQNIGGIVKNPQYADLILRALYLHRLPDDMYDIDRQAIEERYRAYLARSFANTHRAVLEKARERCQIFKEDLMAAAWHPRRVEKWLQEGYSLDEIML